MYDSESDIWCEQTRMSHSKAHFELISCSDKIYAIGGRDNLNPEMYDPLTNQWTDLQVSFGGQIHLIDPNIGGLRRTALAPGRDEPRSVTNKHL